VGERETLIAGRGRLEGAYRRVNSDSRAGTRSRYVSHDDSTPADNRVPRIMIPLERDKNRPSPRHAGQISNGSTNGKPRKLRKKLSAGSRSGRQQRTSNRQRLKMHSPGRTLRETRQSNRVAAARCIDSREKYRRAALAGCQ
jgi:hypothetical protein